MPNLVLLESSEKIHSQLPQFPTESKTPGNPQDRLRANTVAGTKLTLGAEELRAILFFFSDSFTPLGLTTGV